MRETSSLRLSNHCPISLLRTKCQGKIRPRRQAIKKVNIKKDTTFSEETLQPLKEQKINGNQNKKRREPPRNIQSEQTDPRKYKKDRRIKRTKKLEEEIQRFRGNKKSFQGTAGSRSRMNIEAKKQ